MKQDSRYVGKHVNLSHSTGRSKPGCHVRRDARTAARAALCMTLAVVMTVTALGMPFGAVAEGSDADASTREMATEGAAASSEAAVDAAASDGSAAGGASGDAVVQPGDDQGQQGDGAGDQQAVEPDDVDDSDETGTNFEDDATGNVDATDAASTDTNVAKAISDVQSYVESKSEEADAQADDIITTTTDEGREVKFHITSSNTVALGIGGSPTEGNTAIDYTYTGTLSIPSTVSKDGKTYTVTAVESYALAPYYVYSTRVPCKITGLKIPSTVTSIGTQAFSYCSGVSSVTIPASVTSIGNSAFAYTGLKEVTYAAGSPLTSISYGLFAGTKLENLDFIPSTITSIGASAFAESSLTSAVIPAQVTSLGASVFSGCKSLASSSFAQGSTITEIPSSTFYKCTSLKSYEFGEQIVSVEYSAFAGSGLSAVYIPSTLTYLGESAFSGCNVLSNVTFDEGHQLMSISDGLFSKCTSLRSIDLPGNVRYIGSKAFMECSRIREMQLPKSVESIGDFAFQGCTALRRISFIGSAANMQVASNAFYLDNQLTDVVFYDKKHPGLTFQSSVPTYYYTIAYHYAGFSTEDEPNATFVVAANSIPESADSSQVFSGEYLASTPEGNAWTYEDGFSPQYEISDSFYATASQPVADLAVGDTFVARTADGVDVTYTVVQLADGTTPGIAKVGYETEKGNQCAIDSSTTGSVTLPQQVVGSDGKTYTVGSIDPYAFLNCSRLVSIAIPSTVSSIGSKAFARCISLRNVYFESDASSIVDDQLFSGCGNISRVVYGGKKANISFAMSSPDVYYTVTYYENRHDMEIGHVQAKVVLHERARMDSLSDDQVYSGTIPDLAAGFDWSYESGFGADIPLVDSCTAYAAGIGFQVDVEVYAGNVEKTACWFRPITLDESTKTGTAMVGLDKDGVTAVHTSVSGIPVIPASVTDEDGNTYRVMGVSDYAFGSTQSYQACHYLTAINLPTTVASIGTGAFQNCELLDRIEIPATVESMGESAFEGCIGLAKVTFGSQSRLGSVPARAFYGDYKLGTVALPDSATSIGESAFAGCYYYNWETHESYGLTSVSIPSSCTTIGDSAFQGDQFLQDIILGKSVRSIGERAFYHCCAANSIRFLGNAQNVTVGSEAFDLRVYDYTNRLIGLIFMDKKSETVSDYIKLADSRGNQLDFDTYYCISFYGSVANYKSGNPMEQLIIRDNVSASYYQDGYLSGTLPALEQGMQWNCESGFGIDKRTTDSYYAVLGRDISLAQVTPEQSSYYYTGGYLKPSISVTMPDGTELVEGVDWEFDTSRGTNHDGYVNNRHGPDAYICIKGIGNYAGSTQGTFSISQKADAKASFSVNFLGRDEYRYDGTAHEPAVSVSATLMGEPYDAVEGEDYTVSYENNVNAGTGSVVVTGTDSSIFGGTYEREFQITPLSIQMCTISGIKVEYSLLTGFKIDEEVVVVNPWGQELQQDVDYVVHTLNTTASGTGTVKIEGLGNYSGIVSRTFDVNDQSGQGSSDHGPGGDGTGYGAGTGSGSTSGTGSGTGTYGLDSNVAASNSASGGSAAGSRYSVTKLGSPDGIAVVVVNYWWLVLLLVALGALAAGIVRKKWAFDKDLHSNPEVGHM